MQKIRYQNVLLPSNTVYVKFKLACSLINIKHHQHLLPAHFYCPGHHCTFTYDKCTYFVCTSNVHGSSTKIFFSKSGEPKFYNTDIAKIFTATEYMLTAMNDNLLTLSAILKTKPDNKAITHKTF